MLLCMRMSHFINVGLEAGWLDKMIILDYFVIGFECDERDG